MMMRITDDADHDENEDGVGNEIQMIDDTWYMIHDVMRDYDVMQ